MLHEILKVFPVLVAMVILVVWSLVSAFVFRLGLRGSGIGFDYVVFTLIVAFALAAGGAI